MKRNIMTIREKLLEINPDIVKDIEEGSRCPFSDDVKKSFKNKKEIKVVSKILKQCMWFNCWESGDGCEDCITEFLESAIQYNPVKSAIRRLLYLVKWKIKTFNLKKSWVIHNDH